MNNKAIPGPTGPKERAYHLMKLEVVVIKLISEPNKLPVRTLKSLFRTTPVESVFTGNELVTNIVTKLQTERREALHIATQLFKYGYLYAVDQNVSSLKDDSTLYRMQGEEKWPSQCTCPTNMDYSVFLLKKLQQKQKLSEHEQDAYDRFNVTYVRNWPCLTTKAQEEVSVEERESKETRVVLQGEERAFWRLHRPPPGEPLVMESSIQKRNLNRSELSDFEIVQDLEIRIDVYRRAAKRNRVKSSHSADLIIGNVEKMTNQDPFLKKNLSNPWISEYKPSHAATTNDKIRAWSVSFECLIRDTEGRRLFMEFLKSEVSTENLTFCETVNEYKMLPTSHLLINAPLIFKQYIGPTARSEINIDGKTFRLTKDRMEKPDRYTFDAAQNYIYDLMRKDSYSRFLKSSFYTDASKRHSMDKKPRRISKLTNQPLNALSLNQHRGSICESMTQDPGALVKCNSMDALNEVSSIMSPTRGSITGSQLSFEEKNKVSSGKLYRNSSGLNFTDVDVSSCPIRQRDERPELNNAQICQSLRATCLSSSPLKSHFLDERTFSAPRAPDLKNFPKPKTSLSQEEAPKLRYNISP